MTRRRRLLRERFPFACLPRGSTVIGIGLVAVLFAGGCASRPVESFPHFARPPGAEVAVMRAGQVVQQAPPAEVYAAPADPGVARFIGDANLLPGTGSGREAMTAFGTVPLSESRRGPVEVLVRPEELAITARDDASNGAARVELVEFYGHDTVYWVELDDGTSVQVRAGSGPRFSRGDRVALRYRGGETIAYDRGRTA